MSKGTRPLTNAEITAVRDAFSGKYEVRNRGLFMLGISIGGRISELLSLTIEDVWQNEKPVSDVLFSKHVVKGKEEARSVPVNSDGWQAICELSEWHIGQDTWRGHYPLFASRNRGGTLAMTRQNADMVLREAFVKAGLNGKLATHSMRKSFAQRLYDITNDIFVVKELLGHKNVSTTQDYLGVNYKKVREALEKMSIQAWENWEARPLSDEQTVNLINELIMRGYTVSSLNKEREVQ